MAVLEKIVTILSALTGLLVLAAVAFFTIFPKASGYSDAFIQSQVTINTWLASAGQSTERKDEVIRITPPPAARQPNGAAAPQPTREQIAQQTKNSEFDNYVATEGQPIPQDEAVPNIPWVRYQPGVTYHKPRQVPQILHQKLQHFQDAYDAAQSGGGQFEETEFGPAYRINWVKPESYLGSVAGIRAGDKIISVNGHKIGNSLTAARGLYEQLKGESRFAVKILRDGKPTVLSFSVK